MHVHEHVHLPFVTVRLGFSEIFAFYCCFQFDLNFFIVLYILIKFNATQNPIK